jgi:hypothetical protein
VGKVAMRNFEGFSKNGDGQILLKISAPLPLIKTFQMTPLSARSISMDSTFNEAQSGDIHYLCPFKAETSIICAHLKGLYQEMDLVFEDMHGSSRPN